MRELTDEAGAITATYTYDAFGVLTATTSTAPVDLNPYRYCGEQWDFDLSLYFNRARYLNPNSGRFWSMDSYEGAPSDPASLHKYLYANANPVSGIDPSGYLTMVDITQAVQALGLIMRTAVPHVLRLVLVTLRGHMLRIGVSALIRMGQISAAFASGGALIQRTFPGGIAAANRWFMFLARITRSSPQTVSGSQGIVQFFKIGEISISVRAFSSGNVATIQIDNLFAETIKLRFL